MRLQPSRRGNPSAPPSVLDEAKTCVAAGRPSPAAAQGPGRAPVQRSLERELRDLRARRRRLVAGEDGRVDRREAGCLLGPGQRSQRHLLGRHRRSASRPPPLPKPRGASGRQLGDAPSPERTVPSKQTYGQAHQGRRTRRRGQGSIRLVHVSRSRGSPPVPFARTGGKRPAGQNTSAQVEGGKGQDEDHHRNEQRSGEHDPCRYCPTLGDASRS